MTSFTGYNIKNYTSSYDQSILNNSVLTPKIKDILLNSFSMYSLDVGEGFLDFQTMTELWQSIDLGCGIFIVSLEGYKVLLTIDQQMALMELELSHEMEEQEDDYASLPEIEDLPEFEDLPELEDANTYGNKYWRASILGDEKEEREAALEWIQHMNSHEFQEKLLDGTLPKFKREEYAENSLPLERSCYGLCRLMTNDDHETEEYNQGYLKRQRLRYNSVEQFKVSYYEEFWSKLSMEETMKQIELKAETTVIQGYNTGDIQLPIVSDDNTLKVQVNNPDKQMDFLQNIMAEGAKKFEAAAGRPMSYSEMRRMFG
jgi:hypothetical protein